MIDPKRPWTKGWERYTGAEGSCWVHPRMRLMVISDVLEDGGHGPEYHVSVSTIAESVHATRRPPNDAEMGAVRVAFGMRDATELDELARVARHLYLPCERPS